MVGLWSFDQCGENKYISLKFFFPSAVALCEMLCVLVWSRLSILAKFNAANWEKKIFQLKNPHEQLSYRILQIIIRKICGELPGCQNTLQCIHLHDHTLQSCELSTTWQMGNIPYWKGHPDFFFGSSLSLSQWCTSMWNSCCHVLVTSWEVLPMIRPKKRKKKPKLSSYPKCKRTRYSTAS